MVNDRPHHTATHYMDYREVFPRLWCGRKLYKKDGKLKNLHLTTDMIEEVTCLQCLRSMAKLIDMSIRRKK